VVLRREHRVGLFDRQSYSLKSSTPPTLQRASLVVRIVFATMMPPTVILAYLLEVAKSPQPHVFTVMRSSLFSV
jgi:hypothetical protein